MAQGANFPQTRWTLIAGLMAADVDRARVSLEELCRIYWRPIYEFLRRSGRTAEDAEDLTQGFLLSLIERDAWKRAEAERGRLRTFVLSSLQNFLHNVHRDKTRLKRGGGQVLLSLDAAEGDRLFQLAEERALSPEAVFDRQWGMAFIHEVMSGLAVEYERGGRAKLYAALQPFLLDDAVEKGAYEPVAQELGLKVGAVKVAVHRLRGRFRERLVEAVADTVSDPSVIGSELDYLCSLFRPSGL